MADDNAASTGYDLGSDNESDSQGQEDEEIAGDKAAGGDTSALMCELCGKSSQDRTLGKGSAPSSYT